MDRHGLSRLCYLCSITTITLGLSFEGIFMMLLLEQYLHEKSLESSRCVTFRLSQVAQREKCVVCEKSRSPVFPCYEHRVFYVLNSVPPRKRRASNRTISSSGSSSSSSPPPPLRTQLPAFGVGLVRNNNKRAKWAVGTPSAGNGNQSAFYSYAASAARRETPSVPALSRAQLAIRREFMSAEERALHDTRKRIAAYLNVSRKHVLGPVFLYESHYTWTRLNDMCDRERDRANYRPVRSSFPLPVTCVFPLRLRVDLSHRRSVTKYFWGPNQILESHQ